MDKEKEIEEMARVIEYCAHKDCESCRKQGNYRCSAYNKATDLRNAGYGNVKQAVKEFAEKLKEVFNSKHWAVFANAANKDIDNLITELYGADE